MDVIGLVLAAAVGNPTALEADRTKVIATAQALIDSWREADNAKGDGVLHKDFRLTTFQGEGRDRKVYTVDKAGLLNSSKALKAGDWDDRLSDIQVRIGSNGLALLSARYLFYTEGKPGHCGLVSMEMYRQDGAWKIISFADTHNNLNGRAEAEVCPR